MARPCDLFRTNVQARPLETALRQAGVRYHLIGGQSFFDRREVRDFLAYLKTFLNPHDDVSLLRIANTPARGLSDATMELLLASSHERKGSVFSAMTNPAVTAGLQARTRACVEGFVAFIERTREMLQRGGGAPSLRAWAERFLEETGYFQELRRAEKDPEASEGRIRNLKELIVTMDPAAERGATGVARTSSGMERLGSFLEQITLDTDRDDEDEARGDAVTLITMHSCKGLEFPHVCVVGLEGRAAAAFAIESRRHAGRGAPPVLRGHHARDAHPDPQPLRGAQKIRTDPALPSLAFSEGTSARTGRVRGCEKGKQPVTTESGKMLFDAIREGLGSGGRNAQ